MDRHAAVQRGLARVADQRCNGSDFPLFHVDYVVLKEALSTLPATAAFTWTDGTRKFIRSYETREVDCWEVHHRKRNKVTKNKACARCETGVRSYYVAWYNRTFRGFDEQGVHRMTVRAIADCVCGLPKCLACVVRVDWIRPVDGAAITTAPQQRAVAVANARAEVIDLSEDSDEEMSDVESEVDNSEKAESEVGSPDGGIAYADVEMAIGLARSTNATSFSYRSSNGAKLTFYWQ